MNKRKKKKFKRNKKQFDNVKILNCEFFKNREKNNNEKKTNKKFKILRKLKSTISKNIKKNKNLIKKKVIISSTLDPLFKSILLIIALIVLALSK